MSSTGIIEKLSNDLDLPLDLLKTCLLMALSIPLSLGFKVISQPLIRYTFSLTVGIIYIFYLLQEWAFYVLAVALVPFTLFKMFKKFSFQISILTSIGFLMFIHTYRFLYDYQSWKIDCSVPVMMLVTKVVYYGNYAFKHQGKISLFKYMSYCLYFPSVLIGPNFSYTIFQSFIEKKEGYQNPKIIWKLIGKEIVKTIIFSLATIKLMPIFTPYWLLQNKWYLSLHPIVKFLSLNVIGIFYRIKFYSAWGFTQIAIDLSGLSWNQKQQNYSNVRSGSFRFETELNPRNKTNYWNQSVQIWLKQMIFDKVVSQTKSTGIATFVTFFTSALWHGVYFTYYIGFIQWAVIIIISKWGYKMAQSMPKLANNIFVKALAFLIGSSLLNYTGTFIVVLTWNEAIQVYKDMYFIGSILMVILLIASFVIKPKKIRHKHHQKKQEEARPLQGESSQKKE